MLQHLNAIVRYFRLAFTPIQRVGEPSDALYREQALAQATQAANQAFDSGRAEAALLAAYQRNAGVQPAAQAEGESQRLVNVRANVTQRLAELKAQLATNESELATARTKQRAALQQQQDQLHGAIQLYTAMSDALHKVAATSDASSGGGLAGEIVRLQHSVPELTANAAKPAAQPALQSLGNASSNGVTTQATIVFQLLSTRHAIDQWLEQAESLREQAIALRTPLSAVVRDTVAKGQALSPQVETTPSTTTPGTAPPAVPTLDQTRRQYESVLATFNAVSAALVPLTQEIITLEQSRANLIAWRAAVSSEYREVLRWLLLRVLGIALALGVLFAINKVWQRATVRYVGDPRRRRQILVLRRVVIYFVGGLVVIFGFVTQFSSLATFAGFITAGIAVGLQTILLSVAAYFFIVGRYGVRVGDRITVVGVTGDVIDVGLVRFYMMELAGSGTELQPTGRVAVFANSVLFQSGTPLYRQMPGAEYAWHELSVKLSSGSNYKSISEALSHVVQTVYESYKPGIEQQHQRVESWMDTAIPAPAIESRMQLVEGGLQLYIRYPVELRQASQIDGQVTQAVLDLMAGNADVNSSVKEAPIIRALIKS